MVTGILKYSRFLLGSQIIVEVDLKPIKYRDIKSISNPRILRILHETRQFSFSIRSIAGSQNIIPDILSIP